MKRLAGVIAVSAALALGSAATAQTVHQKTGTSQHPGGHSWNNGHKNSGKGVPVYGYSGGSSGGGSQYGCKSGCSQPKKKVVIGRCFPPGHCKSINQVDSKGHRYYGPPGQKGR